MSISLKFQFLFLFRLRAAQTSTASWFAEEAFIFPGSHRRGIWTRSVYGCPKTTVHGTVWKVAFMWVRKCSRLPPVCWHRAAVTAFRWIMTADRPASCPLPTQMKLSLKGIMKATGMEGMQAGIHLIPSFNRLLKIPTIRMMVLQTGPPQSLQNRLQQMAAEWIPTILKKHHLSVKKMILRIMNHPTSLPSHPGRERMIP